MSPELNFFKVLMIWVTMIFVIQIWDNTKPVSKENQIEIVQWGVERAYENIRKSHPSIQGIVLPIYQQRDYSTPIILTNYVGITNVVFTYPL